VLLRVRRIERGGLMGVERLDVAGPQAPDDARVEPFRERCVPRRLGRQAFPMGDLAQEVGITLEDIEDLLQAGPRGEPNACSHDA